jgi:hypothetical protein
MYCFPRAPAAHRLGPWNAADRRRLSMCCFRLLHAFYPTPRFQPGVFAGLFFWEGRSRRRAAKLPDCCSHRLYPEDVQETVGKRSYILERSCIILTIF